MDHYQPDVLVLQDASAKHSRRAPRIRELIAQISAQATKGKVKVKLYSRDKLLREFFPDGDGTKHALAECIAQQFPEDLSDLVPPKRRLWMSEDYRLAIFDAVALMLMPGKVKFRKSNEKLRKTED